MIRTGRNRGNPALKNPHNVFMEWIQYVIAVLFCLLGALCVASMIFSLPGAWVMLGLALLIQVCDRFYLPAERAHTFDWRLLVGCAVLLGVSEVVETAAGAAGAKHGGGSRRGVIGALIGGIIGAIVLTGLIPIPVIGSLIGAVIGTFIGAVIGEVSGAQPKTVRGSVKPALGATIGRVIGTMGKILIAITVWAALSVAAFVP